MQCFYCKYVLVHYINYHNLKSGTLCCAVFFAKGQIRICIRLILQKKKTLFLDLDSSEFSLQKCHKKYASFQFFNVTKLHKIQHLRDDTHCFVKGLKGEINQ